MKYLLDTNVCVCMLRGKSNVAARIKAVGVDQGAISEVTVAELKYGKIYGQLKGGPKYKEQHLEKFLQTVSILPIAPVIDTFAKEKAKELDKIYPVGIVPILVNLLGGSYTVVKIETVNVKCHSFHVHILVKKLPLR